MKHLITRKADSVAQAKQFAQAIEQLNLIARIELDGCFITKEGKDETLMSELFDASAIKRDYIAGFKPDPCAEGLSIAGHIYVHGYST